MLVDNNHVPHTNQGKSPKLTFWLRASCLHDIVAENLIPFLHLISLPPSHTAGRLRCHVTCPTIICPSLAMRTRLHDFLNPSCLLSSSSINLSSPVPSSSLHPPLPSPHSCNLSFISNTVTLALILDAALMIGNFDSLSWNASVRPLSVCIYIDSGRKYTFPFCTLHCFVSPFYKTGSCM